MKDTLDIIREYNGFPTSASKDTEGSMSKWHYPSKGEYPTVGLFNPYMSDKCLVYVDEDGINKHLDMAYYDFREKGWVKFPVPAREEWLNVCAWQLIEPPKENA